MTQEQWINKAALYELLAKTYLYTTKEIAEALVSGEYAEALEEIVELNAIDVDSGALLDQLAAYKEQASEGVFHELRKEYTRLYIGQTDPLVTPFGGCWDAIEKGQKPLLFVGKESMAVERFMRKCGVVQPEGTNEPLDHIASELEFMQFLCLVKAKVAVPAEGAEIEEESFEEFYTEHFRWFAQKFAEATLKECRAPFFNVGAQVLMALPE